MKFRYYKLVNPQSVYGYRLVALSIETSKILWICDDHIDISTIHQKDIDNFYNDYSPSDEYCYFNMTALDNLLNDFCGTKDYSLCIFKVPIKHLSISYSGKLERYHEVDIYPETTSDQMEKELAVKVYKLLYEVEPR